MMAGEVRIPVKKAIYMLVKEYSVKSGLTMSVVTQLLYRSNANVYNREEVYRILANYKRSRRR